jgi:uncharacterized protein YfkK (UPF0435 family)
MYISKLPMECFNIFPILRKKNEFYINIIYNNMASYHTHENYDENEYFIKFKEIHPYLYYANDNYNIKKKEFQVKLLNNLKSSIITDEQFTEIYDLVIKKENNKYKYLEQVKSEQQRIIELCKKEIDTEIIDYMNYVI